MLGCRGTRAEAAQRHHGYVPILSAAPFASAASSNRVFSCAGRECEGRLHGAAAKLQALRNRDGRPSVQCLSPVFGRAGMRDCSGNSGRETPSSSLPRCSDVPSSRRLHRKPVFVQDSGQQAGCPQPAPRRLGLWIFEIDVGPVSQLAYPGSLCLRWVHGGDTGWGRGQEAWQHTQRSGRPVSLLSARRQSSTGRSSKCAARKATPTLRPPSIVQR